MVEDRRKHKKKDDVEEIDSGDRDIECVGLLIHPGPEDAYANKEYRFYYNQTDGLDSPVLLCKSNEESLDEDVDQDRHNEVVCRGPELNVEETPLIKRRWVRVENVGRIFVHADGTLRDAVDFERGPCE